jgi:pimeloyl-ACP methyl ester carboxylesterase
MKQPRQTLRLAVILAAAVAISVPLRQIVAAEPPLSADTDQSAVRTSEGTGPFGTDPYILYRQANFYVGDVPYQMYVQRLKPRQHRHKLPIVLIHGGGFDGSYWLATPDGREGWAPYLVEQGWDVYVVDAAIPVTEVVHLK